MQIRDDDVLLIIDVQNDFCADGALAVADGDAVVPVVNRLSERFDHVVLTQDWHPPGHSSFVTSHPGYAPFESIAMAYGQQTLWPDHCVQGTSGAAFHPQLVTERAELVIRKGFRPEIDSYSAFYENDRRTPTGLAGYLRERGLQRIFLAGLGARDRLLRLLFRHGRAPARLRNRADRGRLQGYRSGRLARCRLGSDGHGRRAARQ